MARALLATGVAGCSSATRPVPARPTLPTRAVTKPSEPAQHQPERMWVSPCDSDGFRNRHLKVRRDSPRLTRRARRRRPAVRAKRGSLAVAIG